MTQVKINLYSLNKQYYKNAKEHSGESLSYKEVTDTLLWIQTKDIMDKTIDLSENKFCWLDYLSVDDDGIISGFFSSVRNDYRPPLVDRKNMKERPNPKTLTEGEKDKTHFAIRIDNEDVFVFMQSNSFGLSIKNIIEYLNIFQRKKNKEDKISNNYSITEYIIKNNNFLTELDRMSRTTIATLFLNKKVLGTNALNYSNRTTSVKDDLRLILSSKAKDSITRVVIDVCKKFFKGNKPIANADVTRIKIKGVDDNNNTIMLDTDILARIENLDIDKNSNTGELNSIQLRSHLCTLARNF